MPKYIEEFVTDFVVTHNEQAACATAKCIIQTKGGTTTVAVALEVWGGGIIMCA